MAVCWQSAIKFLQSLRPFSIMLPAIVVHRRLQNTHPLPQNLEHPASQLPVATLLLLLLLLLLPLKASLLFNPLLVPETCLPLPSLTLTTSTI